MTDSPTSNEALYACECSEVYGSHHPECPARRQFEHQQAEIERLRARIGNCVERCQFDPPACHADETPEPPSKELLNCPFCGGLAEMMNPAPQWYVRCSDCHSTAGKSPYLDAETAARNWNTRAADETSAPPAPAIDEGKLWSFLRDVMAYGCAIETDTRTLGRRYEEHSARLDAAARDAVPQFAERVLGLRHPEKASEEQS